MKASQADGPELVTRAGPLEVGFVGEIGRSSGWPTLSILHFLGGPLDECGGVEVSEGLI